MEAEVTVQTDPMSDLKEPKAALRHYLQSNRDALLWKLDGLSQRDLRMPRTPTGTNLVGIVKHMANVEIGYLGDTFGREWPTPEERISDEDFEADPQADWYATESETCDGIIDLYRRVWTFADATIEELPLDALGRVPWWPEDRNPVALERHHGARHRRPGATRRTRRHHPRADRRRGRPPSGGLQPPGAAGLAGVRRQTNRPRRTVLSRHPAGQPDTDHSIKPCSHLSDIAMRCHRHDRADSGMSGHFRAVYRELPL
jgi:hypothetical protein